jgi:hypothetical protein
MSHKKSKRPESKVTLNMAAMLDMAFQLLTFFIMTFKPDPLEGQIDLRLPKPEAVAGAKGAPPPGADKNNNDPIAGIETLVVSIPSRGGNIDGIVIGQVSDGNNVGGPSGLDGWFKQTLSGGDFPFQQVILQVGTGLRYAELMRVVDVCVQQTLPDGRKLTKMSFVELPEGG